MLKIETSLDWATVETEIVNLSKLLPQFKADINRFRLRIERLVRELGQLEVEARRLKSAPSLRRCEEKANQINEELKQLGKLHLMTLLHQA